MPEQNFRPAWWLPSPHLQTLWPVMFRSRRTAPLERERLELDDGDFLDLCWLGRQDGPWVVVVHGLEGSVRSHYAAGILNTLSQHGYNVVFMHFRGCSGEANRLPRSYHSGDTGDIAHVVDYVANRVGSPVHAAVGYSLGGNALLKWLGETGENNPLQRAVAVSVPFDLAQAADRLETGLSRLYQDHLLRSLKRSYARKFAGMPSPIEVELDSLQTFRDFDDAVTAPLHGFRGVDHYYGESSSRPYLRHIRTPTRIIHSLDDPFMFPRTAPGPHETSEAVDLVLTEKGGHVGFIGGTPWKPVYWHEEKIVEFLGGNW